MHAAHVERVRPRTSRVRPVLAALVTLVVFLTVTAVAWTSVADLATEDAAREFERNADQAQASVQGDIDQYYERLRDIGAFAATADGATPAAFADYVEGTRIFDQLPSVVGVLYINRVPDDEVDAFVARTRQSNPDFAVLDIAPDGPGDVRYLLTYYAPGRVDLGLPIGTDVSPIQAVTSLLTISEGTGTGIAGSFQEDPLLQNIADRTDFPMIDALLGLDFFIGVPVYAPGTADRGRSSTPVGWAAATIGDFDEVAAGATDSIGDDLGLALTIELAGTGMIDRNDLSRVASIDGGAGPRGGAAFETSRTIEVEGNEWTLDVWSGPDADALPASTRITLAAGIAGSALAAGLVYVRLRERDRERVYASETAEQERFQREILDSVTNAMVVLDDTGRIVRANPAWHELWAGRPADGTADRSSWVGVGYLDTIGPQATTGREELDDAVAAVLAGRSATVDVDVAITRPDAEDHTANGSHEGRPQGATTVVADRTPDTEQWLAVRVTPLGGLRPGAIVIHTDITERKRSHDQLQVQAARDDLTGLANRSSFERRVELALTPARAGDHRVAVLFIDLDGFKPVNDTFGHAVGDEVLRAVGRRIDSVVRSSDTAARLGGDEFVVLIDPLADPSVAEATAERILSALATPIRADDHHISLAASIGVAVIEGPTTESAVALIERADAAMYASKQQGGGRTTVIGS